MAFRKSPLFTTAASLIALTALTGCQTTSPFSSRQPVTAESHNASNYEEAMKRGAAARADGKLDEAAKNYMRAAEYQPQYVEPLIALADVLWLEKKAAESAKILEHAHRINGDNDTVLRNLGRAYVALNEPQKAQSAYLDALAIDPNSARTLNGLGVSYDLSGDYATAQQHYRAGLSLAPNDVDLRNNLAYSLITDKEYAEAINILERLVKHPRATARQRNNLALAYGLSGRDADAKLILAADHAPAQIERNLATYRQMRGEPMQAAALSGVGRPNFENGSLPEPQPMASPPVPVAEAALPSPSPEPAEMVGVPDGSVLLKPEPEVRKPQPAPPAAPPAAPPPTAVSAVTTAPVQPIRQQPVELVAATPLATTAPAPAAVPLTAPPAATSSIAGSAKIYLGRYENESLAREAWIKVWTANSATLSSLVASIEPNSGQMALYAVGADNQATANSVCLKLRQNGVSCGVSN